MKKILSIILVLGLMISLAGCNDTTSSLSYNLEQNVNRVKSVLEQTKEVSNDQLVFNEILSLSELESISSQIAKPSPEKTNITNMKDRLNTYKVRNRNNVKNNQKDDFPVPDLTKQIVKNPAIESNSTLDLTNNQFFKKDNENENKLNRLTTRRSSNSSRLTSPYYIPRRAENVNYNNSGFNNYLGKIEDLYLMMNDAVCTNNDILSCKDNIFKCCDLLNILCGKIRSNEIQLNDDQINSCNELLSELGKCTNKVTSTRNEVANECNSLNQVGDNLSFKIDQINSKYVKLINCLDNRSSYYNNLLSILQQLQCILTDSPYQQSTDIGNGLTDNLPDLKDVLPNQTNTNQNNKNQDLNKTNITDDKNIKNNIIQPRILIDREKDNVRENAIKEDSFINQSKVKENNTDMLNNDRVNTNDRMDNKENMPQNTPLADRNDTRVNRNDAIENRSRMDGRNNIRMDRNQRLINERNIDNVDRNINNTDRNINNADDANRNINRRPNRPEIAGRPETVADFNQADDTKTEQRKLNIDTYKEETIKPNILEDINKNTLNPNNNNQPNNNQPKNGQNNNQPNNENNTNNNQNTMNNGQMINNPQNGMNNGQANNAMPNAVPNGIAPNINTYGYNGMGGAGVGGAGVGGVGTGVGGVGIAAPGVGGAGIGMGGAGMGAAGMGGAAGGVGMGGVGAGPIGRGYVGMHNFENGIINPYRNTDTYKLTLNDATLEKPLPSEARRNFKPFAEIENKTHEINPLLSERVETKTNDNTKTTITSYKVGA